MKAGIELMFMDAVRQRLFYLLQDRAAADGPREADGIPEAEREMHVATDVIDAAALTLLRSRCRKREVTFHSMLW